MNTFLRKLTLSMFRVFAVTILNHLNPFTITRLLETVSCNHIQLTDSILQQKEAKEETKKSLVWNDINGKCLNLFDISVQRPI